MSIRYLSGIDVDANNLFVDSANDRVGIGTGSPAYKLDVSGTGRFSGQLNIVTNVDIAYGALTGNYIGQYYNGTDLHFYNGTGGANLFSITRSTGVATFYNNVGIGTTSPTQKLQVDGNVYVNDDGTTGNGIMLRGADRPLIARGWDPFTSGNKTGVGRWGVYMESSELFIGAPGTDYSNALITLGGWLLNGTRQPRLTVNNSTGNVGIGTTAPGAKLEVVAGNTTAISVRSGNSGQYSILSIGRTSSDIIIASAASSGQFWTGSSDGDGWVGSTNGTLSLGNDTTGVANLTIKAGNVGIGTTSPLAKLHVEGGGGNGTAWFGGTTVVSHFNYATDEHTYIRGGKSTSSVYIADNNTGNVFIANGGGNVGIGTTSPGYKLDVVGESRFGSGAKAIVGTDGTYGGYSTIGFGGTTNGYNRVFGHQSTSDGLYLTATTGHGIDFWTNGVVGSKMYINASGNVGIGTTSPTSKLYVEGGSADWNETTPGTSVGTIHLDPGSATDNFGNAITFGASDAGSGATAQAGIYLRTDGGYGTKMYFATTDAYISGSKTRMFIGHDGNVGIGTTSPGAKLEVSAGAGTPAFNNGISILTGNGTYTTGHGGILQFQNEDVITAAIRGVRESGWGSGMALYTHSTSSGNTFGTTVVERMRITEAGNVGIGTTSPSFPLSVAGKIGGTLFSDSHLEFLGSGNTILKANNDVVIGYSQSFYVTQGGNVGIGTTSPLKKLVVTTGNNTNSSNHKSDALAYFGGGNDNPDAQNISFPNPSVTDGSIPGMAWWSADVMFGRYKNEAFWSIKETHGGSLGNSQKDIIRAYFYDSGGFSYIDKVTIPNGKVGIGTTAPTYGLVVANQSTANSATGTMYIGAVLNGSGKGLVIDSATRTTDDNAVLALEIINRAGGNTMAATVAGNVGIGTTAPEKLLHISGGSGNVDNLILQSAYVSAGVGVAMQFNRSSGVLARIRGIEEGSWNGGLLFEVRSGSTYPGYNGATDVAMKIATNGNVGIGTTSPGALLHVAGVPRFDASGGAPSDTSAPVTQEKYYGTNSVVLTSPNNWLKVEINGTAYVIPAYSI